MERREKREEGICACFFVVIRVNKCAVIVVADDAEAVATVVAQTSVACIRQRPCSWELGRRTATQKEREKREEGRQTREERRGTTDDRRTTTPLARGRLRLSAPGGFSLHPHNPRVVDRTYVGA